MYTVTRDSGANVKLLKRLERDGFIKIFDVKIENGRENKKVPDKVLPVGVYGHAKWSEAVYASDDCKYQDIRKIIGRDHIEDAMQLEAHIRSDHDYIVTEDTDFLKVREELEEKFEIKIVTPFELENKFREAT